MITAQVSGCTNSVYKWMVIFRDSSNSVGLNDLFDHLKELHNAGIVGDIDAWIGIGHITAFFEELEDVMMVKLKFCGAT